MSMTTIPSKIDRSVNFVHNTRRGTFESRYVRRPDADYFVCYLSSHAGCDKACRFCHLTQTGQTSMIEAQDFMEQAIPVLQHNQTSDDRLDSVHYSFMARGDALASSWVRNSWHEVLTDLYTASEACGVKDTKIKISTIMPEEMKEVDLRRIFGREVDLYYSFYSQHPLLRKKWLPKALDYIDALYKLRQWQKENDKQIIIHMPFITGFNDGLSNTMRMIDLIKKFDIDARLNLIRYNPPNDKSAESDDYLLLFEYWKSAFPDSKIIDRVGLDVKASCGMFV